MQIEAVSLMRELRLEEIDQVAGAGFWADFATAAGAGTGVGALIGTIVSYGESGATAFQMAANGGVAGLVAGSAGYIGWELGTFIYNSYATQIQDFLAGS